MEQREDDIIELGVASSETKGPFGEGGDMILSRNTPALSDD